LNLWCLPSLSEWLFRAVNLEIACWNSVVTEYPWYFFLKLQVVKIGGLEKLKHFFCGNWVSGLKRFKVKWVPGLKKFMEFPKKHIFLLTFIGLGLSMLTGNYFNNYLGLSLPLQEIDFNGNLASVVFLVNVCKIC